jgi:hypothetical protein
MDLHDRKTWLLDAITKKLSVETYLRYPLPKKKGSALKRCTSKENSFMA